MIKILKVGEVGPGPIDKLSCLCQNISRAMFSFLHLLSSDKPQVTASREKEFWNDLINLIYYLILVDFSTIENY